jgi:hypothetical protein
MVVRPLASMRKIFASSGIHYSVLANGQKQAIALPYICYMVWESNNLVHDFVLVDPQSDTEYKINNHHWFSNNPLIGKCEAGDIQEYPFIVANRNELGAYSDSNKSDVHDFVSSIFEKVDTRVKEGGNVVK